ncbi:hypothetical protein ACWEVT_43540, partial [Saccharopolyspora sp. NPDC003762]
FGGSARRSGHVSGTEVFQHDQRVAVGELGRDRRRQAEITQEISEIVGGASALADATAGSDN